MPATGDSLLSKCREQWQEESVDEPVSIVVGVAIAGGLAGRIMRNRSSESDLGFVSHQWIAERRLSWMSDAQR
jgi:hypothetical protein